VLLWDARQPQTPAAVLSPGASVGAITTALQPQPDGVAITVGTRSGEVRFERAGSTSLPFCLARFIFCRSYQHALTSVPYVVVFDQLM